MAPIRYTAYKLCIALFSEPIHPLLIQKWRIRDRILAVWRYVVSAPFYFMRDFYYTVFLLWLLLRSYFDYFLIYSEYTIIDQTRQEWFAKFKNKWEMNYSGKWNCNFG